jgi:sugar lactone lactonase YvrE
MDRRWRSCSNLEKTKVSDAIAGRKFLQIDRDQGRRKTKVSKSRGHANFYKSAFRVEWASIHNPDLPRFSGRAGARLERGRTDRVDFLSLRICLRSTVGKDSMIFPKPQSLWVRESCRDEAELRRRDFLGMAGGALASLVTGPLLGEAKGPDATLPAPRVVLTWGTNGTADGEFDVPIGIAVNRKDEIFISDFRQSGDAPARVQRFAPDGRFLGSFETEPMPGGLAFDKEGLLYCTHMMDHKVTVHEPTGKLVREFGKRGTALGEFEQPGGIAFGPDGSVYIADQVNRRVQRLTPAGEPISAWGKYGVETGEFGGNVSAPSRVGGPHFLAFDSHGHIYTTEGSVGRIQKFKADGTFVMAFGDNQIGPGHFGSPKGLQGPIAIAIDAKDNVWVTSTNHLVQQFTADGRYLRGMGGEGEEIGQFKIPHGLAVDSLQHLYVADSRNSRIQKIEI